MKAIIIEDEIAATNLLSKILDDYCPNIDLIGKADSIQSGISLINELSPELIFLDIRLNGEKSFDMLDKLEDKSFYLIITTAYDEYAIKAFKYDAIDYILKPYVPKDIILAVNKALKQKQSHTVFNKLNQILQQTATHEQVSFATSEGLRLCTPDEILRLEASGSYCKIFLLNETLLVSKSLAEIERTLSMDCFIRVHSGHTVNKKHVKSFKNADGGYIEMNDGSQVPIARRRKQDFFNQIK